MDAADQPNRDGDIRLTAQAGNPAAWAAGTTGQFSYSSVNDDLYHYNGSTWVASGGGTAVINLSCAWGTDYTAGANHGWDGSCTPQACPAGWTSVATYSEPLSVSCSGNTDCAWNHAGSTFHPPAVGRSVRVCVK